MPLNPYLIFNGNAREVALYYAEVFGAPQPRFMTFGDAHSDHIPKEAHDLIMHTYVEISGTKLMISDNYPGDPISSGE